MQFTDADFLNRELSWLEFNRRVLNQALDSGTPLLERVKFLNIFTSNLDEFFMKRVGGLKRQLLAQASGSALKHTSPRDQLAQIRKAVTPLVQSQAECITGQIIPALAAEGIRLVRWEDLTGEELAFANHFFHERVFPVLTPLAVDSGHPFPFISNLSLSFGVLMRHPNTHGEELFARVKVPEVFPSWIRLNPETESGEARFVSLYETIGRNLTSLFRGMEILDVMLFSLTRNADVEKDEEDADDLLEMVAEELRERRFASVVRLEHGPNASQPILRILLDQLDLGPEDVYELPLWFEYFALDPLYELARPNLKYPPWAPVVPPALADSEQSIFEVIKKGDVLVHHPYESFAASVERFIRSAVEDPKVMAIKMMLYRTGDDSPFIPLLIRAAEAGKQVVCLVELKARFDEASNILVAQRLEKAGVHVVYGIVGLKTHSKISLVVRQESNGVIAYAHVGTGNYHARTARLYTDVGIFTANPVFTEDVIQLFHYITGRSSLWIFKRLIVAPHEMKVTFLRMIEREIDHAKAKRPARIIVKLNNLEDRDMIEALYRASAAGVKIDLIVRSICCLRPQTAGLSENIRVISVVGRFLEHSRIFYFRNGAAEERDGEFFMGSADWMHRNLSFRVEAVAPVEDPALRARFWDLLNLFMRDSRLAWEMKSDGSYEKPQVAAANPIAVQEELMRLTRG